MQGLRTSWGDVADGDIPESSICTSGLPNIVEQLALADLTAFKI